MTMELVRIEENVLVFVLQFCCCCCFCWCRFQAYSNHDKEVGYCQGLSFIVAMLVLHVSALHDGPSYYSVCMRVLLFLLCTSMIFSLCYLVTVPVLNSEFENLYFKISVHIISKGIVPMQSNILYLKKLYYMSLELLLLVVLWCKSLGHILKIRISESEVSMLSSVRGSAQIHLFMVWLLLTCCCSCRCQQSVRSAYWFVLCTSTTCATYLLSALVA